MLNALAEEVACRGEFSEGALVSGEGLVTFQHVVEQQGGRSEPAPSVAAHGHHRLACSGTSRRAIPTTVSSFRTQALFAKRRVNPPKSR